MANAEVPALERLPVVFSYQGTTQGKAHVNGDGVRVHMIFKSVQVLALRVVTTSSSAGFVSDAVSRHTLP